MELECKIVSGSAVVGYKPWIVELRKPDGVPLYQALKGTGDTLRVKDLKPGIYELCIRGRTGERCESVDLSAQTGGNSYKFKRRLVTPDATAAIAGTRGVSVAELSIPKEAKLEMVRSEEAELAGKSDDAFKHLERALALYPDYPAALNNLGVHYYRVRDYDKSIECLRKATELNPSFYPPWANLGSSILATGKFQEALKVNRHTLGMRPGDARANMLLGLNLYYMRDYPEAKKYLEQAFKLDPLSASSPQLFLAEIAILERNNAEAGRYLRDFLKLHPNSSVAFKVRGVLTEVEASHAVSIPGVDLSPDR